MISCGNFNLLFGWRKFSWVDKSFNEVVTSTDGIGSAPRPLSFMEEIINEIKLNQPNWQDNIIFYTNKSLQKGNTIKMIDSLVDSETGSYLGSVVLSYDVEAMIKGLSRRKQDLNTNFVIIDKNLDVIAQSSPNDTIKNIEEEFSPELKKVLGTIDFLNEKTPDYPYLGMMDGVNFYIKPAKKDLPFVIVINIDNNLIRDNILNTLSMRLMEASVFAAICLVIVISIYKRETTLRARAERATTEANKATKAKTNFLAFTAHELRSPLGFILTGSEMMVKEMIGPMPESYMNYAQGIHQNANIILQFISDILDENQIIEGKFKIVNSFVNIKLIIREAVRVNRARYNDRKVTIKAVYLTDTIPLVICDSRRMVQVFSNLISNGIKYSNDGTRLKIVTFMNGDNLEIHVVDKGIGMSKDEIRAALSTYGTVQKSSYGLGSYGLGLPIVKMLLDAHDAELKIESNGENGTVVKVIFPKYKLVYNASKNTG